MALPNVPKTNWESDDGATFTDMNEIGENIQDLEDDKIESGDTVVTLDITTANITTLNVSGAINPAITADTSQSVGAGSNWVPSRGCYIINGLTSISVQANLTASWRTVYPSGTGGFFMTDGDNVRVNNASGSPITVFYFKF